MGQHSKAITHKQKMRGLRWLLAGEGLNSGAVMLALTTPFVLFLDELGFSKSQIGLLSSLIHLTAPLALIIAPAVERFGLKRTYLTFMSTRNAVLCCMIMLPWMIAGMGFDVAFICAIGLMGMYGLLRVIAEIALYPWMVEAIPNSVRGRFVAMSSMVSTATRLGAVLVSGYVIGQFTGLWRYQTLIAFGCCLGLASVLVRWKVLGGEPQRARSRTFHLKEIKDALSDRNLLRFVVGAALLVLGTHSWGTFAPLFLKDVVGLSRAEVVLLQSGTMLGGVSFSYLWGHAADRYGSKPVLIVGIAIVIGVPLGWLAMPVHSAWSLYWAVTIAVMAGVGAVAWEIGHNRMLYVNVVPAAKKMVYMAIFYAVVEIIRFIGPLASGLLLDHLQERGGGIMPASFGLDGPYQSYFTLTILILVSSLPFLLRIQTMPVDDQTEPEKGKE